MNDFYVEVDNIVEILKREKKEDFIKQITNAKLIGGGQPGETFDIICCLLKTYEISNPLLFNLVKIPATKLYNLATELGREPLANFDIFQELSK